jgi:glycosyltransferase involved in cell wall biosynthesis
VLVGEGDLHGRLGGLIRGLGLEDCVRGTGWVPTAELPGLPAAADLGVVLRTPSAGETSAAAVRFLACGTPVAVGGGPQFLEWPEAAAPRLVPGPAAAAALTRVLAEAAAGGSRWELRREAARAAYAAGHRPAAAARALVGFLDEL